MGCVYFLLKSGAEEDWQFTACAYFLQTEFSVEWKDHKSFVSIKGPSRETAQWLVYRVPGAQKIGACIAAFLQMMSCEHSEDIAQG